MSRPAVTAPPGHLSTRAKGYWRAMSKTYELADPPAQELLRRCCEAMDRADQAREEVDRDGATFKTRYGEIRPHPAVAIERDARTAIARLLRELRVLDSPEDPRPGRLGRSS